MHLKLIGLLLDLSFISVTISETAHRKLSTIYQLYLTWNIPVSYLLKEDNISSCDLYHVHIVVEFRVEATTMTCTPPVPEGPDKGCCVFISNHQ